MSETSGFKLETKYAVAMWDFSWLVRRTGDEAEYADWDKVLDELAQRGYNCVRIDAFPHLLAKGQDGKLVEQFTVLPQAGNFMWGNHKPVQVEPRKALVEFIGKAAGRGIYVGLSAWYNRDTLDRIGMIQSPQDYAHIWLETLDLLAEAGLHDRIVWVDVCNEFPINWWAPGPYSEIFRSNKHGTMWMLRNMQRNWDDEVKQRIRSYFEGAIMPLRERYPDLKYTFSFQSLGSRQMQEIDVSAFDVAEVHIWVSDYLRWMVASGQVLMHVGLPGYPRNIRIHARRMAKLYPKHRDEYTKLLESRIEFWSEWGKRNGIPLFTTEAWGPISYDDVAPGGAGGEWDWVKDICEQGVRMASERGWKGMCTSNFCQPHFEGMWADVQWHKRMTDLILRR
jgi:hypothetical protein